VSIAMPRLPRFAFCLVCTALTTALALALAATRGVPGAA
jgi:hypothetical protein